MGRYIVLTTTVLVLCLLSAGMLGAAPQPGGVPPQPFLADYFSGRVVVNGRLAPLGTELVACVDDCNAGFQSHPVRIGASSEFQLLEINPEDRSLRGRVVRFYLVNPYGRIQAEQTAVFEGAYNINDLLLIFPDPLPTAPLQPDLPAVGDAIVPLLPRYALGFGALALLAGVSLLLVARWRSA